MELGFELGDLVDVDEDTTPVRGTVTRIDRDKVTGVAWKIEIVRPGDSHNEFEADPENGFDFVTKVVS